MTILRKMLGKILIQALITCWAHQCLAVATNVNEVSKLFEEGIADKVGLEQTLKDSKDSVGKSISGSEALQSLPVSAAEAEKTAVELDAIEPSSLEAAGNKERAKAENQYLEKLEVDYSSPLVANHKKDTDMIATASGKLLSRLIEGLKEIGVDCRQVKGNKEIEPHYHLEIIKEPARDTVYNQSFCEELRGNYDCRDVLTLTCLGKEMKWEGWQGRSINIDGGTLYHHYRDLGYAVFWKTKRWGWHVSKHHPWGSESPLRRNPAAIDQLARQMIASRLGVSVDHIGEDVGFPDSGRGHGEISPLYDRWRVAWAEYGFNYRYRDGKLVCSQWQENWTESCRLK